MNITEKDVAMARIAVVNDDQFYLEMMGDLLEDLGHQASLKPTHDGAYGVIKQQQPDLVIVDIRMERPAAGVDLIEALRRDPETMDIPILVITADIFFVERHIQVARQLGCAIMTKPFIIDDLQQEIERLGVMG